MVRERLRPGPESPRARPLHLCTEINPSAAPAPGALAVPASLPRSGEKDDNFRNRSVWARKAGGVEKSKYFTVRASMKKTGNGGGQILSLSFFFNDAPPRPLRSCGASMWDCPHRTATTSSLVVRSIRHYEHGEALNSWNPLSNGFLDLGKNERKQGPRDPRRYVTVVCVRVSLRFCFTDL